MIIRTFSLVAMMKPYPQFELCLDLGLLLWCLSCAMDNHFFPHYDYEISYYTQPALITWLTQREILPLTRPHALHSSDTCVSFWHFMFETNRVYSNSHNQAAMLWLHCNINILFDDNLSELCRKQQLLALVNLHISGRKTSFSPGLSSRWCRQIPWIILSSNNY